MLFKCRGQALNCCLCLKNIRTYSRWRNLLVISFNDALLLQIFLRIKWDEPTIRGSVVNSKAFGRKRAYLTILHFAWRKRRPNENSPERLSSLWEAANCAATHELPTILVNPEVHYSVHKSPPLILLLSHIDPVHTIPFHLSKIFFIIVHPPTSWSN
jgi:hypothetical protein